MRGAGVHVACTPVFEAFLSRFAGRSDRPFQETSLSEFAEKPRRSDVSHRAWSNVAGITPETSGNPVVFSNTEFVIDEGSQPARQKTQLHTHMAVFITRMCGNQVSDPCPFPPSILAGFISAGCNCGCRVCIGVWVTCAKQGRASPRHLSDPAGGTPASDGPGTAV